jgi:hypothetical protein
MQNQQQVRRSRPAAGFFLGQAAKKEAKKRPALRRACERVLIRIVVAKHLVHPDHCVAADSDVKIKLMLEWYHQSLPPPRH